MSDKSTQVLFEVPREVIDAQVKAAVVRALTEGQTERLIDAVVQAAMTQKKDSYSRSTIWDEQVNKMIREAAKDAFQEWLEEHRGVIRDKVRQKMEARKGAFITKITDSIAEAMTAGVRIDMSLFRGAED